MENNIVWHDGEVTYEARCKLLGQKGIVLWFTGLSGSGKSTVAVEVEKTLTKQGKLVYRLDGDNIRHGLNNDLGFSKEDRDENIRRIAEVAKLFCDAGIITLVSFITPFKKMREGATGIIGKNNYIEIYVKCSLEQCMQRDPKGLYKKAKIGKIKEFTGISSIYEEPDNPDIVINTDEYNITESAQKILEFI